MFQKAVERFHQLDDGDISAVVDESVISFSGVRPAPGVGESVELRLTYLAARFPKQDIVVGVRVEWRIQINEINTRIRKFPAVRQPLQVVAKIEPIHRVPLANSALIVHSRTQCARQTAAGAQAVKRV